MSRVQESVGYTGKYRNRVSSRYDGQSEAAGVTRLAIFLVVVGLVGPVIPQFGFVMWIVGWAICLVLFIASIIMMAKGAPLKGCVAMLFSLIVLPLWIVFAPVAVLMATDARGWKQVFLDEVKKQQEALGAQVSSDSAAGSGETNGNPLLGAGSEPGGLETITSKDGRTIRGTIEAYDATGVRMKREDGQVVNVTFDLMSPGDMQKYRDRYNSRGQ
ncbi:hypothetical protein DES53_102221 [Roseimicrobium gellanilyticum]|uniref:Uncharacterized protein n=1 Tax=Roseimicrobium gellanilyticum TaxID=748857 RepID=A0A366HRX4_9BACT|nr:hypothetical protein [Roseimicrobium gellanilyticum]RBP45838.1 hypothetical protein DES53_102221 [Roseimicrobium gellanilyticum]